MAQVTADRVFQQRLLVAVTKSTQSLNNIARMSRVHQPTLYRFVRGKQNLSVDSANKLGEYLGVQEPADDAHKDGAEKLLALLDHYRDSGEFIEQQIPICDDAAILKELRQVRIFNMKMVKKFEDKLREDYPDLAID
jgi:hypothetical protein